MEKITSFTVDHLKLLPGLYVSRVDTMDNFTFTTFDLRVTRPNFEPVMDTSVCHTIEHLGATYFRNKYPNDTMYFGPMGCRTGFYLIVKGNKTSKDYLNKVIDCMKFITSYEGAIPGASAIECGNYLDLNLDMAKYYAKKYLEVLENENR
ncbi:MAG: S-ribosylhomocysteine lyase [Bacilli bacterium]|nr:S-ribosylhomocysteine lyase [Bacilli bacterium]MBQ3252938.1 S-ribosylhomocysteine lyase [Acholeplasmatales bacterium]